MADDQEQGLFPDTAHKLAAPKKMSEMERNRRAAEEKFKKEESLRAETLREFEEAFGVKTDDRDDSYGRSSGYAPSGPRAGLGGGGRAYDGPPPRRSGPGTLDTFEPPPMSIAERKRRRAMEEDEAALKRESDGTRDDRRSGRASASLQRPERDTTTAPKNSVRLTNLPPLITNHQITTLLRGILNPHSIDIMEQPNPHNIGRRQATAVVVLAAGTSTTDIEKAISTLKDRYLGCGYFLSISRYLPSDVLYPSMPDDSYTPAERPFGAVAAKRERGGGHHSMSRAPPPSEFAPPGRYDAPHSKAHYSPADAVVQVRAPVDLPVLRLIHLIASWYLSQEDMNLALEKENQLLSIPQVQSNPLYAFLYDPSSDAGVYFRWLLWNPDGLGVLRSSKHGRNTPLRMHDDLSIDWLPPQLHMPYAGVTDIAEILSHLDFDSDEEADDDLPSYRDDNPIPGDEHVLGPLRRARFAHMLARLPLSRSFLERRHVAPIQNFAMIHANRGGFEIVDMVQCSIHRPFNASGFSVAAPPPDSDDEDGSEDDDYHHSRPPASFSNGSNGGQHTHDLSHFLDEDERITAQTYDPRTRKPAPPDLLTDAKLVMLDIVTVICIASYHAATPGSHRYRKLFPEAFLQAGVIVDLARTPAAHAWGIIKTDRWDKRVRAVFKTWEENNCFAADEIRQFRRMYEDAAKDCKRDDDGKGKLAETVAAADDDDMKPVFKSVEEVMREREAHEAEAAEEAARQEELVAQADGDSISLDDLQVFDVGGDFLEWRLIGKSGAADIIFEVPKNDPQPTLPEKTADAFPEAVPAAVETAQPVKSTPQPPEPVSEAPKKDIDMFADDSD